MKVDVDWPAFMARQDMVWDRLPRDYYEGPFVGNGLMGTIIFKDDKEPDALRFEIGRTDIYDNREGVNKVHERCRLPIGQALLKPVGKIVGAKMRVDLWNAETRGELTTDAGTIKFRCFAPSDEIVVLVELTTTGKERDCRFTFRPQQGNCPRHTVLPKEKHYKPNPPFQVAKEAGMDVCVQPLLTGGDYATAWKTIATGPDSQAFYIHVANGIPAGGAAQKAVAAVNHAVSRGVADMERAHREWWHAFYPASFVSLPDARIESFYWIQWYKLASAMREGRPMVDLFGPWFRLSRWAAYWQNLNTQLSLYTVHAGNQLSLGEPMCQWLENSMEDLINNAPAEYRQDSASLGNPTNLRLIAPAPGSKPPYHFIGLPWLAQHEYLQYRYTMDDQRLREKVYPLLRRAFSLYLHYLKLGDDGRYHIPLSFSDEYGNAEDTNLNLALLRWGLQTLIACNDRLQLNDPMLPKWKETLAKLADYPVDEKTGLMIGKDMPFARPHRHYSHLFAIFPLYVLNVDEQPGQRAMMEKSIRTHVELKGDDCMYKFTGSSSLSAALGDGDDALRKLQRALTITPKGPTVRENTLYSEGGWPTFESPISAARNVLDMLIQSWGGTIRIFPACPSQWQDVIFHNLRAEGAFLVSAGRKDGKTQWVRIKSLAGEPCRVQIDGKVRELKLAKGEEVVLGEGEPVVAPLPADNAKTNAWGAKNVK